MADRKITLFELHFDEGFQVGPKMIGLGSDEDEQLEELEGESETDAEDEESTGGPNPVAGLLALVVLVGIALAIRRLVGGGDDEEFEQEELEEFEAA